MKALINVGVAQIGFANQPSVLRTILGSCVGICIYDRMKKMGGMAHVLLPNKIGDGKDEKYADTAIPILINHLLKDGCKKEFMSAKIAGGASMFKFKSNISLGEIGSRNVQVAREILQKHGIPLMEEDVGGSVGRVLDFFMEDGRMKVKAAGEEKLFYKV